MRLFVLNRLEDESGISGIGIVAEGVQFWNRKCALCWKSVPVSSVVIYDNIEDLEAIHGHNGKTVVEWIGVAQYEHAKNDHEPPVNFPKR